MIIYYIYKYIIINILYLIFKLYSYFNEKAYSRESAWQELLNNVPEKSGLRILVHAASMGEFEQAKPLIEEIKKLNPEIEIIASFFSPSGFENQKDYSQIDYSLYLPIDTEVNSVTFVKKVNPDIAIFVRYELWSNILSELKKSNCRNYLICATKPSSKYIYNNYFGKEYLNHCYNQFEMVFTVSDVDSKFIQTVNKSVSVVTSTDTRTDRILSVVTQARNNPILPQNILDNYITLIAGSSWEKDEEIISVSVNQINSVDFKIRVIYVPHVPNEKNILRISGYHSKTVLLSKLLKELETIPKINQTRILEKKHIIVDSIGSLLQLYGNSDIAYVGCGFGDGVHSVSEPAGYGLPIICGPNISSMPDAVRLFERQSLIIIKNSEELIRVLNNLINDDELRYKLGKQNQEYILDNSGSSKKIVEIILNNDSN